MYDAPDGGQAFFDILLEATPAGARLARSVVIPVGKYALSIPDPEHGAWTTWRDISPPDTGWNTRFLIGQRELQGNEAQDVVRFFRFGSANRRATPQMAWEDFQGMRTQTFTVVQPPATDGGGVLLVALESSTLRYARGSLKIRLTLVE